MHHQSTASRRSPVPPPPHFTLTILFTLFLSLNLTTTWRPYPQLQQKNNITELIYNSYKKYEGSSGFIKLKYHMGPVLTENIAVHIIWYGTWPTSKKKIIREFINSISDSTNRAPSVFGYTLPYAWIGNSAKLCLGVCAYPFVVPDYIPGLKPVKSPNGDVGIDGMISVIGHELAELASNSLVNAWYAGQDPSFLVEIADLCEGIYGTGGGGLLDWTKSEDYGTEDYEDYDEAQDYDEA
uniref:Uncharacterized protein n=1 Tax=Tanacetum cinerariifolium TaxID=118510 RepID=A0A699J792_TANCI|nr:hypothetical protein [Tanacetum cinerariifolium]